MKTYLAIAFAIVVFVCAPQQGWARSLDLPQASPARIFPNQATTVTVTVHVSADPQLIPSSVNLIQVTAQGQPLGVLGSLYDNGTHGDLQSGDGIFTGQFTFNSAATIYLQATAAYRGTRVKSRTFSVDVGPASFNPGTNTPVANQMIGPSGGTILVANSGTPLDGSTISFPVGALSANTQVKVSFNLGTLTPGDGVFSGAALVLDVTGVTSFSQPVSITVPYTAGSNSVPVPYYADSTGALRPLQIVSIDRQGGTFTFQTFHASVFTWIWSLLFPPHDVLTTGYLPSNNGFQVVNTGSTVNRDGECFGMTSFSLWFWLNETPLGNFYPKYYDVVGTDSDGNAIRGQNVIATRAFTSILQKWTSYIPTVTAQENLTPAERYASIHNIIANTQGPVLIYLYHPDGSPGAHSVLAYAIDNTIQKISIYDPNLPGTVQNIQYSSDIKDFKPYCNGHCYSGIVYNGDGSLNLAEPYSNILTDAQNNFDNSGGATINITSHTNGQKVSSLLQTLTGVVDSGQVLISKLTAIVGSTEYGTNVGLDGSFSIPIALTSGVNHLKFRTEGNNAQGVLIQTSNNFDTMDFTLDAVVPTSVILMTLTWDTNDTDLDTYVIDPTGDYSAYYHKKTADGGTLDRDVTTGFGPEHWTLLNTATVRYNQPYTFRVHYYSDHGNGPSNYTVTIELYEGTSRQITYTYTGGLAVSNPTNYLPNGSGPDWADIAVITLTPDQ